MQRNPHPCRTFYPSQFQMKKLLILAYMIIGATFLHAQTAQIIAADSIKFYEGKLVTVCEKVIDTHITKENKVVYLNFGHPYPAQTFTGVIFASDVSKFNYEPAVYLKGKTICVTGTVKIYKDRPEIIINRQDQIQVK
jgi:hypothetical protein